MGLLSVQNLTILLALVCIVVTAALCTGMAVDSGDRALDKTKSACSQQLESTRQSGARALSRTRSEGDKAVDNCFATASSSVTARTEELLLSTVAAAKATVDNNMRGYQDHTRKYHDFVYFRQNVAEVATFAWLNNTFRPFIYPEVYNYAKSGITAILIYAIDDNAFQMYEEGATLKNPPDGLHEYTGLRCNGIGTCVQYAAVRSLQGGANYTPDPVYDSGFQDGTPGFEDPNCKTVSSVTGKPCEWTAKPGCRILVADRLGGQLDAGVCELPSYRPLLQPSAILAKAFFPSSYPRWIPPVSISSYMGLGLVFNIVDSSGGYLGLLSITIETASLSRYLAGIEVGGDAAITRLFITMDDNWLSYLSTFSQAGHLVATSEGNATTYTYELIEATQRHGYRQSTREGRMAQDPLIRGTIRHIEDNVPGTYSGTNGTVQLFAINSTKASGGWVEEVPGYGFGPPVNETQLWVNGYREKEDKDLPPAPGYVADGTMFFITSTFLTVGIGGPDMQWWVTMIIDREYVLGATDRAQEETRVQIQASNEAVRAEVAADEERVRAEVVASDKAVQDDLDTDRLILYITVGACAVFLMLLSVFFVSRIVAPINRLAGDMAEVAHMKLENVDESAPPSALGEVQRMELSFLQMIKNLREYRSYMPASVLVDDDDDEDIEAEAATEVRSSISRSVDQSGGTSGNLERHLDRQSTKSGSKYSRSQMASTLGRSHANRRAPPKGIGVGLHKKKVAILTSNIKDFSQLAAVTTERTIDCVAKYLDVLVGTTQKLKGLPDTFCADRYYATFNAVKPCATAKTVCAEAAVHCISQALPVIEEALGMKGGLAGRLVMLCAGGDVHCGNIGTDGMKKFCCIGFPASFVHVLCRGSEQWKVSAVCDSNTVSEASQRCLVRLLPPIQFKSGQHKIGEVQGMKKVSEDEWMYQLEEGEKADPNAPFNGAIQQWMQKDYASAKQIITADKEVNPSPQHEIALQILETLLSQPEQ
eukprot:TRINITY_DN162_c1_g2_i1.p1 TRINITY_DN162_c1_g2~~TRINITY_DN162_c1_g2_i1.p1  ORF type:complete len:992 (+),score=277.06 TRINITY_DN162_c1_g2_i1:417-3392(+)